jgi:ketosteroid isomerase-like protein
MSDENLETFAAVEDAFTRAIVSNDVAKIAACMTDDWVLVTSEVGPVNRSDFLQTIKSGVLAHDTMTMAIQRVKVYGDVAVVTGRGQNTGTFRGRPIRADEWITDVFTRIEGEWRCALTHLTPVTET